MKPSERPKKKFTEKKDESLPFTVEDRKHPLAKCEECPLAHKGKYVPSRMPDGTNPTGLAFIGEAPAQNEIRQGEPFVGASGQLLDAVLDNYGIDRNNTLLTNACSCHYPKEMKALPHAAVEACRPRLIAELEAANVDTAVVMGNSALRSVTAPTEARKGVTKLRAGPPRTSIGHPDLPTTLDLTVVPTFHPAACLRTQASFPLMVTDIGKAIATDKPVKWYEPTYDIINHEPEALEAISLLTKSNRDYGLIVDTESGRDKDTSFGRDDGVYGRILCIGIEGPAQETDDHVYIFTDYVLKSKAVRDALRTALYECGSIMQNGKYDVAVLMKFLDCPPNSPLPLLFDTMLGSYCLNEFAGVHGLEYMGMEILGAPDWKHVVAPYLKANKKIGKVANNYADIPRDILYKYNAFDVHVTRMVYSYLNAFIDEQGLNRLNNFLLRLSKMLVLVENRGMGFDYQVSKEIEAELDLELDARKELFPYSLMKANDKKKRTLTRLNPNSWQQILFYLSNSQIHSDSTDENRLKEIIEHPEVPQPVKDTLNLVLEYRKHNKQKGTYVTGLQEKVTEAGSIHPSFLIHGTNTGRLSSRNPNAQNIPRKGRIKQQFIPKPNPYGNVLIQVDYSQAELRTLTWLGQEPTLRDLFNDPSKDVFVELCTSMFPEFPDLSDVEKKERRTLIKTFAYGISYGRTAEGIAADPDFKMSVEEAEKHLSAFQAMIPNIMEYQQKEVIDRIHAGHDLINPFGRHKRFHLITDMNKKEVHNEALAYLPQSTASDMCLEAACRLTDRDPERYHIVNLIHDAMLLEAHLAEANEIAKEVDQAMCEVAREITGGYVDFATDFAVGSSWYEVK